MEEAAAVSNRAKDIKVNGNLELEVLQQKIHQEFGIVMIPPDDVDKMTDVREVDDIVFSWTSCPPDSNFKSCW